jgi:hypothetical protein
MRWQYVRLLCTTEAGGQLTWQFTHDVGYDVGLSGVNGWTGHQYVRAFDSLLDTMGADGWELVTTSHIYNNVGNLASMTLYFKRAF